MSSKDDPESFEKSKISTPRFPPPASFSSQSHISSPSMYEQIYQKSLADPDLFWLKQSERLSWYKKPMHAGIHTWDVDKNKISHTWFEDGQINVSANCLDRHLESKADKIALIWQGDDDKDTSVFTFRELHSEVCRVANFFKDLGIKKGDRICIYLPMIPELSVVMLACARIGAVHSVVFGGYSAESLKHRIHDSSARILVTANEGLRGGKTIPLKETADTALEEASSIEKVLVIKHTDAPCAIRSGRDLWYHEKVPLCSSVCEPTILDAEDPLFILYTSGSTGKPKGVVHSQAGYLLYASLTHYCVFDIHEKDVYWCTADMGWITGHSYGLYGPLCNGTTTLMYEGIPTHPDPGRYWQIIDKFQVNVFYTAPTILRSLIRLGSDYPNHYSLASLKVLGSVGEPINPESWLWEYEMVGKNKCPLVDTWWQTETGGMMITPLPGCHTLKPGSASKPFFGVEPVIMLDNGAIGKANEDGALCIAKPWPGIMRTLWGDHQRFIDVYFKPFKNIYYTGDGCWFDDEGDYWLLGRLDDVVNISGHRLGTAEVESALVSHPSVAEAAVVPIEHEIKGQALYAFVILKKDIEESKSLKDELKLQVRNQIGAIAVPERICFTHSLPKTRSGKIMRRILRKIVNKETEELGDLTALADMQIVKELIEKNSKNMDN